MSMSEIKRYSTIGELDYDSLGGLVKFEDYLSDTEQREQAHAAEVERLKGELSAAKQELDAFRTEYGPDFNKQLAAKDAEIAALKYEIEQLHLDTKLGNEAADKFFSEMDDLKKQLAHQVDVIAILQKLNGTAADEIAALTKALDRATSNKYAVQNDDMKTYTVHEERDYSRLTPDDIALCERLFGGDK